jgi:hypothetical protein
VAICQHAATQKVQRSLLKVICNTSAAVNSPELPPKPLASLLSLINRTDPRSMISTFDCVTAGTTQKAALDWL